MKPHSDSHAGPKASQVSAVMQRIINALSNKRPIHLCQPSRIQTYLTNLACQHAVDLNLSNSAAPSLTLETKNHQQLHISKTADRIFVRQTARIGDQDVWLQQFIFRTHSFGHLALRRWACTCINGLELSPALATFKPHSDPEDDPNYIVVTWRPWRHWRFEQACSEWAEALSSQDWHWTAVGANDTSR